MQQPALVRHALGKKPLLKQPPRTESGLPVAGCTTLKYAVPITRCCCETKPGDQRMRPVHKACSILVGLVAVATILSGCQSLGATRPNEHLIVDLVDEFSLDQPSDSWLLTTPDSWQIRSDGQRRFLHLAPLPAGHDERQRDLESAIHRKYRFRSFSFSAWLRLDRAVGNRPCNASMLFGWQDDGNCLRLDLSDLAGTPDVAIVQVANGHVTRLATATLSSRPDFTRQQWHQIGILRNLETTAVDVYIDEADKRWFRPRQPRMNGARSDLHRPPAARPSEGS